MRKAYSMQGRMAPLNRTRNWGCVKKFLVWNTFRIFSRSLSFLFYIVVPFAPVWSMLSASRSLFWKRSNVVFAIKVARKRSTKNIKDRLIFELCGKIMSSRKVEELSIWSLKNNHVLNDLIRNNRMIGA